MSLPYPAYGRQPGANNPYDYPPNGASAPHIFGDSTTTIPGKYEFTVNRVSRTPSPTPSETAELARSGLFDWKTMSNWRFWLRREWIWYYVLAVILTAITLILTVFHHQIVDKLTPVAKDIKNLPGGWSIPIVILFVLSFPPLFGHEIVAILCGVVWGIWVGFAIVAAGTFIGELGNFYAFKYCCSARGEKAEKTNIRYACLAQVVREGGFKIAVIARYSAIPGHFTTAVFSTCGMPVWTFALAAFLSLPKQLATVYIGVIVGENGQKEKTSQRVASYTVIVVTTIVTFLAARYILRKLVEAKPDVIYARRKARQAKIELSSSYYNNNESTLSTFNPNPSDSDIPLQPYDQDREAGFGGPSHQQWDESGHAIGYAPDPRLHAPRPRPPSFSPTALYTSPAAAAAVTASQDPEDDEWTNARSPSTARAPDPAPIPVPTSTTTYSPRAASSPTSYAADHTVAFPPPPQSPRSAAAARRARSPELSLEAQYVTYHPDHFTENTTAISTAQQQRQHTYASADSFGSEPPRVLSPPPNYR
ncbi:snare associated Golgi protein-domain-containing protein [Lactarius quietus]|nr:snare associated Golgi protein-domain-containing protein [Lactarius quietus]